MNAVDFYAVVFDSGVRCIGCLRDGVSADSPDVHPIFANSEWDYVPVCEVCGSEHDYVVLLANGSAKAVTP